MGSRVLAYSHESLGDDLVFPSRFLTQPAHLEFEGLVFGFVVQSVNAASASDKGDDEVQRSRHSGREIPAHFRNLFQGLPAGHLVELQLLDLCFGRLPSLAEGTTEISLREAFAEISCEGVVKAIPRGTLIQQARTKERPDGSIMCSWWVFSSCVGGRARAQNTCVGRLRGEQRWTRAPTSSYEARMHAAPNGRSDP